MATTVKRVFNVTELSREDLERIAISAFHMLNAKGQEICHEERHKLAHLLGLKDQVLDDFQSFCNGCDEEQRARYGQCRTNLIAQSISQILAERAAQYQGDRLLGSVVPKILVLLNREIQQMLHSCQDGGDTKGQLKTVPIEEAKADGIVPENPDGASVVQRLRSEKDASRRMKNEAEHLRYLLQIKKDFGLNLAELQWFDKVTRERLSSDEQRELSAS